MPVNKYIKYISYRKKIILTAHNYIGCLTNVYFVKSIVHDSIVHDYSITIFIKLLLRDVF